MGDKGTNQAAKSSEFPQRIKHRPPGFRPFSLLHVGSAIGHSQPLGAVPPPQLLNTPDLVRNPPRARCSMESTPHVGNFDTSYVVTAVEAFRAVLPLQRSDWEYLEGGENDGDEENSISGSRVGVT